jgi:hypothetical protein
MVKDILGGRILCIVESFNIFKSLYGDPCGLYITIPQSELEISKIKTGDWYVDDCLQVRQAVTSDVEYWKVRKDYEKIIASNDKNIIINIGGDNLPYIPLSFIETYIVRYNECRTLKQVEVETETKYNNGGMRGWQPFPDERSVNYKPDEKKLVLKVDFNGYISIMIPEFNTKSVDENIIITKKDLEILCRNAFKSGCAYAIASHELFKQTHLGEDEWVEKFLK